MHILLQIQSSMLRAIILIHLPKTNVVYDSDGIGDDSVKIGVL